MQPIIMPQIGQDVETGVITRWAKKVGDPVKKGEVVATVEGDKAAFDIESPADGVLLQIAVEAGQEGRVLGAVGFVGTAGEKPQGTQAPQEATAQSAPPAAPAAAPAAAAAGPQRTGRLFSSPAARRVASERGVDIGSLTGTGPGGRIMKKDVLAAHAAPQGRQPAPLAVGPTVPAGRTAPEPAAAPAARAGEDTVIPHTRMRQLIADRLTQSKQTIPHFYLFQDVDMEEALAWRELYNARNGCKVTVTDMVVWAVAATLREFPRMNAHVDRDKLVARGRINVGLATATDDGLLVPAIADTDTKDIRALSAEIKAKAEDARKGKLDLAAKGTFTVTSLGMFGTQSFLPIINPPEAAILGVGAAEPRPVAIGTLLGVHRVMTLTLSCDHRAVNGAEAAKFLKRLEQTIRSRFVPAA
jgi:pyruvate dehydrogenase E2 component (dihydrolipoamide acetyltransferase)